MQLRDILKSALQVEQKEVRRLTLGQSLLCVQVARPLSPRLQRLMW